MNPVDRTPMLAHRIAALFRMTDEVWARHASGWSVWTRFATLPILLLALWSHVWIGPWAIAATLAVMLWLWLNPRLFAAPADTDHWWCKVTFGERVWLNRGKIEIPAHHVTAANLLSAAAGLGFLLALGGALLNLLWPMLLGAAVSYAGKLWFCDRMVWLYEDMKDRDPQYRSWLRS